MNHDDYKDEKCEGFHFSVPSCRCAERALAQVTAQKKALWIETDRRMHDLIDQLAQAQESQKYNEGCALADLKEVQEEIARLKVEPTTPEEIHKKLGAMMAEEERLMDRLEELGDITYVVSDESVERTRKNISIVMDLTQQRNALRAQVASVSGWAGEKQVLLAQVARLVDNLKQAIYVLDQKGGYALTVQKWRNTLTDITKQ